MKSFRRLSAWCMTASVVWSVSALGETIILRTQQTLTSEDGGVTLAIELRNTGREPAHDVRIAAWFGGAWTGESPPIAIAPGQTATNRLALSAPPGENGVFVAVARARFTDAAGYPAAILAAAELRRGDTSSPGPITSAVKAPATIRDTARIAMALRSAATAPLEAHVRLFAPDQFGGGDEHAVLRLDSGQTADVAFTVTNRFGRAGSAYRVAMLTECEVDGVHHARVDWARLRVPGHANLLQRHRLVVSVCALAMLCVFLALQRGGEHPSGSRSVPTAVTVGVFVAVYWFLADHLPPALLFLDTITAGGDTVAHHYLASHLSRTLFSHGRIVSWAQGWWCGFPAFQFYFPLPYLLAALLDLALPFNVAFKLVTVLGVFLLPAAAWTFARRLRLPEPGPLLLAVASIPFLFDRSNTMWGANIYSTLAGMISNSLSFALMPLLLGCAAADADEGRFRLRTSFLVAALIASHFFTSIMAAALMAALPLLRPRAGFRRAAATLAAEGALGMALMAWWLIPLIAKRAYAVDFGENWPVNPWRTLPPFAWALVPFAAAAVWCSRRGGGRFVLLCGGLTAVATALFFFGFRISPVFVNVRLWPFMVFGITSLGAAGLGLLLADRRHVWLAVVALALAALSAGIHQPNTVRGWAEWNYTGIERKPRYDAIRELALPLAGTPGRLAYDLHPANNVLGSSRAFEIVPHLTGKPIVEGGIVNSAEGSLIAYYVQSETSDNCAGFPTMVRPTTFDITNATAHLTLLNASHFIARSPRTRAAFAASGHWIEEKRSHEWTLFRARNAGGGYVSVYEGELHAARPASWKLASLEWLYRPTCLETPVILLDARSPADAFPRAMDDTAYLAFLNAATGAVEAAWITNRVPVVHEEVSDMRIAFRTRAVGKPHIVKIMYYPNWRVHGAARIFRVTPGFMLVVPDREDVELVFGYTLADRMGQLLSFLALAIAASLPFLRRLAGRTGIRRAWD